MLAVDNTLGPNSPFAGTVYAAYVDYFKETDPNQHVNPTTNTDIVLAVLAPTPGRRGCPRASSTMTMP